MLPRGRPRCASLCLCFLGARRAYSLTRVLLWAPARVLPQGKKGTATGAKKEGAKTPKDKKEKVKAAAPPKDLTGKKGEKTPAQLQAEEVRYHIDASYIVYIYICYVTRTVSGRQTPQAAGTGAGRDCAQFCGRGQGALRSFASENQPCDPQALVDKACGNSQTIHRAQKQGTVCVCLHAVVRAIKPPSPPRIMHVCM